MAGSYIDRVGRMAGSYIDHVGRMAGSYIAGVGKIAGSYIAGVGRMAHNHKDGVGRMGLMNIQGAVGGNYNAGVDKARNLMGSKTGQRLKQHTSLKLHTAES